MNSLLLSLITFVVILAGALGGMALRRRLPASYLGEDAKDVVRLGAGLTGTIAALVLGLLIASAKNSYDTQATQTKHLLAGFILVDGLLAQYGPEATPVRQLMRRGLGILTERIWQEKTFESADARPFEAHRLAEAFLVGLQELSPQTDAQKSLKERAIAAATDLARARLLLFAQIGNTIPMPFLMVLVFWLTIIFASFGLFAQPNAIVVAALVIFPLSASFAIFLILELGQPFAGLMQISSEPLRNVLPPLSLVAR